MRQAFICLFSILLATSAFAISPERTYKYTPADYGLKYEQSTVQTDDGYGISVWHIPTRKARASVVVAYPDAGNMAYWLSLAYYLKCLHYDVWLFDWRGFGESSDFETKREMLFYDVIRKRITKIDEQAEAPRTYNYPYAALEEILSNAVYHKSWDDRNPIEVRVNLDSIQIYSMAGPMPPITNSDLQKERVVCRNYRNRRIGDFLKELDMTEGRSTGFPKIYKALKRNGSPAPQFETDEKNQYFLATVKIHPMFLNEQDLEGDVVKDVVKELTDRQLLILNILRQSVVKNVVETAVSIATKIAVTPRTVQRELAELQSLGLIRREGGRKNGHWEVLNQIG